MPRTNWRPRTSCGPFVARPGCRRSRWTGGTSATARPRAAPSRRDASGDPVRVRGTGRPRTKKAAVSRGLAGTAAGGGLRQAGLLHHFGGVVLDHLLDALADGQALEADHFGAGGLEHGLDLLVGVEHVVLAVERDLVDDLGDLAADDLLQDVGGLGLVLVGHLGQLDLLFLGDELGRDVGSLDVRRVHGRDVHRQAAGQLLVAALDLDQHADAAAVDVGRDVVGAVDAGHAADLHVLADLGDQLGAGLFDGLAVDGGRLE